MEPFRSKYKKILFNHLKKPNEKNLFDAYAFGKEAGDQKLKMSDLIEIHFSLLKEVKEQHTDEHLPASQEILLETSMAMSLSGGMKTMETVLAALYDETIKQFKELQEAKAKLLDYSENLELKVEEKLHEVQRAEERFEILVKTIPDLVYKIDEQGNFVYLNESVASLGYRPQELIGKHFSEIILAPDRENVSSSHVLPKYKGRKTGAANAPGLVDERRTGERMTRDLEVRLLLKSGKSMGGIVENLGREFTYVEINSSGQHEIDPLTKEKKYIGTVGVIRDITGRKKAEQRLSEYQLHLEELIAERTLELSKANEKLKQEVRERCETETALKNILESMGEGLVLIDPDYCIVMANAAFAAHYKASVEEIVGRKCHEISHHSQKPCDEVNEVCPVHDTFATGEPQMAVHEHIDKEGHLSRMEIRSYPLKDQTGNISFVIEIMKDITEQEKLESQLRQSQKMEAVGTMAGGIAHDFNNILAIIIGYSELALNHISSENPARQNIQKVLEASERATNLVGQILAFSRKEKAELIAVSPEVIIKETLKLLRSVTPTSVSIIQEISSNCGTIKADPTQFHQLLMNLFANAVQAMDEKGEMTVSLQEINLKAEALTHKPGLSPGPYACLSISDNGIGMDKKVIERIFDPFYTTKEVGKGTGMGLSVVHSIIESHRGFIDVESELGQGSTFNVFLPVIEEKAEKILEVVTTEHFQGGTERILLVDDEKMILEVAEQMLESMGYEVTTESSSVKALEMFKSNPDGFDLLITDQSMPNMLGAELSIEILKARPDMPIILCTGYSNKVSAESAREIGLRKYMTKPYKPKELSEAIREVMNGKV